MAAPGVTYEYLPDVSFIATRLRFGSDEWDPPAPFYDWPDVNEQGAVLWTDGSSITAYTGGIGLSSSGFRLQRSSDNGASRSEITFPLLRGPIGSYWPQPINTAWRDISSPSIYLASDGAGAESLLWASEDDGLAWRDTGGRTGGRHTSFVRRNDGCIIGFGGKNSNIGGYMPQFLSCDRGRTWKSAKTDFPALSSNQRPTVIRLASGRLFFASDWQDHEGWKPPDVRESGSFVALSSDDGLTWIKRTLPTALPHEGVGTDRAHSKAATIGYAVAAQSQNGLIHLITSLNRPAQEFEINEQWILTGRELTTLESPHWLNGERLERFPSGQPAYQVTCSRGKKVGREVWWNAPGQKTAEWYHEKAGRTVAVQYWPNGNKKHESLWQNGRAEGPASEWDANGKLLSTWHFHERELAGKGK